jgi:hypothetical protein
MTAGTRRWRWRGRLRPASREVREVIRRVNIGGAPILLAVLVAIGGIGVVEIPWIAWKLVRMVASWVIGIARTEDATGVRGWRGREVYGLPVATNVAEIVRLGIVVRRFAAGGLVRIRSSVPTHADALLRARSPPQAGGGTSLWGRAPDSV